MAAGSRDDGDLPLWLRSVPVPSEEEFEEWDKREAEREQALDVLTGGLLAADDEQTAQGYRMLEALAPTGSISRSHEHPRFEDALSAALNGHATTQELVDGYRSGELSLTEAQETFVGTDSTRLRVLVLSIQEDVSPEYLERRLFPDGQPRLTMAARSAQGISGKLAAWLDQHPEVTGAAAGIHWRA